MRLRMGRQRTQHCGGIGINVRQSHNRMLTARRLGTFPHRSHVLELIAKHSRNRTRTPDSHRPSGTRPPQKESWKRLWQKVKHLRSSLHGVDHEFIPAIEDQNDRLQQSAMGVEPEPKLPSRTVIIEFFDPNCPCRSLDRISDFYPMLTCRGVNPHAEAKASRITSERDFPSRSARASRALISSAVRRKAITCDGSAPRPGRPRPRFLTAATSIPASASAAQSSICSSVTGTPFIVSRLFMKLMLYENARRARAELESPSHAIPRPGGTQSLAGF